MVAYHRRMRRVAVAVALLIAVPLGLAGCAETEVTAEDAYKVGCPAVDAAAAGGTVAGKAAVGGLKALRASGQLDPEPEKWLDAAIDLLESGESRPSSDATRQLLIDGCADNGYPLRNLS